MSGIPVFSAGTSLQSSGASVSAQIPADSAGMLPLFVRVTATAAGYFRLSQDGASASIGDLLIQPSDGLILKTCGLSQFSFVSQSGASTVTVTPIDVGGIKYPTNIFTPAELFTTGVNGAWYDPSDFSTLFQDAAGTTPVTAVGQPVGLMLDKSKGLVLGPELVTNGDFSNGTNGWTAPVASISAISGVLRVTATSDGYANVNQGFSTVAGKTYKVSCTLVSSSAAKSISVYAGINAFTGNLAGVVLGAAQNTRTAVFTATSATSYLFFQSSSGNLVAGDYYEIDNISVRELPGNHAFNPSGNSANFPVLQQDGTGRYYLAFNGVNQWLQTNSIDFTYGDKMFVSAGVRKLSDAGTSVVGEFGYGSNGYFVMFAPDSPHQYNVNSKGTVNAAAAVDSGYAAPITNVISGIGNISGDQVILRANGAQAAISTSDQGTGNYGNYPLYIGARAGTSLWFNGRLYGLVVAGKQASASEIASTEAWLNQKTGAY